MKLDFFYLKIEGHKFSLLCSALAELEEMNYERLITKDEVEEIEAICNYDFTSQIQNKGIPHHLIEEVLFIAQIDQLIELIDWYGCTF